MNELITVSLLKKDISALIQFPVELMSPIENKLIKFIIEYSNEYGVPPTIKRVVKEIPAFIPFFVEDDTVSELPPLGDLAALEIKNKLAEFTLNKLEKAISQISSTGEIPLDSLDEIEKMVAVSTGISKYTTFDRKLYFRRKALDFPFRIINRFIRGIGQGDFILLIGRLGTGKSTLAQFIAKEWFDIGKKVLYISCEMLATDIFSRVDAMEGKFNPLALREPEAEGEVAPILLKVMTSIAEGTGHGEIYIPSTRVITTGQVAALAKNLAVDAVIVDGIYLMRPIDKFASKWEKVASISNELKQFALDSKIPVVGITQIKRGASEDIYDPEDIAYSDALGQDADFVLAIKPSKAVPARAELQLIKNRYGPTGVCNIYFDFPTMTITDEAIEGEVVPETKFEYKSKTFGKPLVPEAEEYHEIGGKPEKPKKVVKPKVDKEAKVRLF